MDRLRFNRWQVLLAVIYAASARIGLRFNPLFVVAQVVQVVLTILSAGVWLVVARLAPLVQFHGEASISDGY